MCSDSAWCSGARAATRPRIDRRRQLVPDLHRISIQVAHERIGFAGNELARFEKGSAGALHSVDGVCDRGRVHQAEAEVGDVAASSAGSRRSLEHEDVAGPRRLCLDEIPLAIDGDHAEDPLVEPERARRTLHAQRKMGEAEGGYCRMSSGHRILGPDYRSALPRGQV